MHAGPSVSNDEHPPERKAVSWAFWTERRCAAHRTGAACLFGLASAAGADFEISIAIDGHQQHPGSHEPVRSDHRGRPRAATAP